MKRPTIKQLQDVRFVTGNGWGDGDILEWFPEPKDKARVKRSLRAFDKWIESLQGKKFTSSLI